METFVLRVGKFVNVEVKISPHGRKNVAQISIVMKPKRLVLKEKSYHGMQNVMANVLKDLADLFIFPLAKILQYARDIIQDGTCVMD